jgi:hypothetical protein
MEANLIAQRIVHRSLCLCLIRLCLPSQGKHVYRYGSRCPDLARPTQLLRPDFSSILSKQEEAEIFDLIGRLIQTFSSPEIAIDDRHTPRLYARFLAGLLSRHRREGGAPGRSHQHQQPPQNSIPRPDQGEYKGVGVGVGVSVNGSAYGGQVQGQGQGREQVMRSAGTTVNGDESGYEQPVYNEVEKSSRPTYQEVESDVFVTGGGGGGPIEFDMMNELGMGFGSVLTEEEMLATMQALKNPAWWQNMMMPGYVGFFVLLLN